MPRVALILLLFALGALSFRDVIFAHGSKYPFTLMELPYGEAELEPHISTEVCALHGSAILPYLVNCLALFVLKAQFPCVSAVYERLRAAAVQHNRQYCVNKCLSICRAPSATGVGV